MILQQPVPGADAVNPIEFFGALSAMVTAGTTIFLAIVAAMGLRSLKLTQADMLNRAKREARECAIDRCREMADELIHLHMGILRAFREKKIAVFVEKPEAVTFGDAPEHGTRATAAEWVRKLDADLYKQCVILLNAVETWSMYFTKGLADADATKGPCANVYMGIVIQLYPLLVYLRADDSSGVYPNTVQLFQNWYGERIDARNRVIAEALVEAARELQVRGGAYEKLPDPIGTKVLK